jgi:hypothetical protein
MDVWCELLLVCNLNVMKGSSLNKLASFWVIIIIIFPQLGRLASLHTNYVKLTIVYPHQSLGFEWFRATRRGCCLHV